jgi:hypothetical protein
LEPVLQRRSVCGWERQQGAERLRRTATHVREPGGVDAIAASQCHDVVDGAHPVVAAEASVPVELKLVGEALERIAELRRQRSFESRAEQALAVVARDDVDLG